MTSRLASVNEHKYGTSPAYNGEEDEEEEDGDGGSLSPQSTIVASHRRDEHGFFDMVPRRSNSPDSVRSDVSLGTTLSTSSTVAALTALQYLPIPLLVLSSQKTVLLANDAFARLLNIELPALAEDGETLLSITELLRGRRVGDLGIDVLKDGSPMWIKWEVW